MCEAVRDNFTGVFIAYGHNIASIIESIDSISRDGPDVIYT